MSRNHAQQPTNTAATNYAQLYEMKIKESLSKGTSMIVQERSSKVDHHQHNFSDLTKSKFDHAPNFAEIEAKMNKSGKQTHYMQRCGADSRNKASLGH